MLVEQRDQAAGRAGRGGLAGLLARRRGRLPGDRRLVHDGRRMERTMTYRTMDVPVRGGMLRVGEWAPADPDAPVVVAAHGITASHLAWATMADALPDVRFVAPDLRGRGRSNGLPGPFGMVQHADDLAAVSESPRPRPRARGRSFDGRLRGAGDRPPVPGTLHRPAARRRRAPAAPSPTASRSTS